jgi:hypothetical protein
MYSRVGDSLGQNRETNAAGSAAEELEDILDDPHCRHLLDILNREDGSVPELTLARRVVGRITNTAPEDVDDDVARRVQTWLHHGQLPILDEHGLVEFDAGAGEVRIGHADAP